MGAFNALDELLPGPATERPRLEAVAEAEPAAPEPRREARGDTRGERRGLPDPGEEARRGAGFNALDELLPGPLAPRPRLQLVQDQARRAAGGAGGAGGPGGRKHLATYNPLDDLRPEPPAPKARVSLRVSAELLQAARDATAYLSEGAGRVTLGDLAEDALRAELQRLAVEHNSGRPFPPKR